MSEQTDRVESCYGKIKEWRASLDLTEQEWQAVDNLCAQFTTIVEMNVPRIRLNARPHMIIQAALAISMKMRDLAREANTLQEKR